MSEKKGMKAEDFAYAVIHAQLKRERGETLTKREERVLAYGYHQPACHHPECR